MTITVIGSGYVGLVAGACLAEIGNDVVCLDLDAGKIAQLNAGVIPIFEPGLEALVLSGRTSGRLHFTTDYDEAISKSSVFFIAVGTPPDQDGAADLQYVLAVAQAIGERLTQPAVIVNKSTVPVGTAEKVEAIIRDALERRGVSVQYSVVSNPEFMKEGAAIEDFMRPDRIIIGSSDAWAVQKMRYLYGPLNRNRDKIIVMDPKSAELAKYAANAMLATRISFMNELAQLSEKVGADVELVRRGIGSDPRIGSHFLYAGLGYGGSCFPKDVRELIVSARRNNAPLGVLEAVEAANERQKRLLFEQICLFYGGRDRLAGKTVAVWGLAFKPNTDDMREAPSKILIAELLACGAIVKAYDPQALSEARKTFGDVPGLVLCSSAQETLVGSDVLAIVTEWREFRSIDLVAVASQLQDKAIFDGRNMYERAEVTAAGLEYFDVGRRATSVGAN